MRRLEAENWSVQCVESQQFGERRCAPENVSSGSSGASRKILISESRSDD